MWFKSKKEPTVRKVSKEPVGSCLRHLEDMASGEIGHTSSIWIECYCYKNEALHPNPLMWVRKDGTPLVAQQKDTNSILSNAECIAVPAGSEINKDLVQAGWAPAYTFTAKPEHEVTEETWVVLRRKVLPCSVCTSKTGHRCPKCQAPVCLICGDTRYGAVRKHYCASPTLVS